MKVRTFDFVAKRYLSRPTKSGGEKSETAHNVLEWMSERWKGVDVADIDLELVEDLVFDLRSVRTARCPNGLKQSRINSYLVYLRATLNYAARMRWVDSVPRIEIPEVAGKEVQLTKQQLRKFLNLLDPLRRDLVQFGLCTGLRNANVRLLTWRHLDDTGEFLRFHRTEMKNGRAHIVPMNADALAIIRRRMELKEDLEFDRPRLKGTIDHVFFQDNGRPFAKSSLVNRKWRMCVKEAGIQGTTFHDMRHTWATMHLEAGTNVLELKAMGGWQDMKSLDRYTHVSNVHAKTAANRIGGMANW